VQRLAEESPDLRVIVNYKNGMTKFPLHPVGHHLVILSTNPGE